MRYERLNMRFNALVDSIAGDENIAPLIEYAIARQCGVITLLESYWGDMELYRHPQTNKIHGVVFTQNPVTTKEGQDEAIKLMIDRGLNEVYFGTIQAVNK